MLYYVSAPTKIPQEERLTVEETEKKRAKHFSMSRKGNYKEVFT